MARERTVLRGIAASPGVVVGPAVVIDSQHLQVRHRHIDEEAVEDETDRVRMAVEQSREELEGIRDRLGEDAPADYRLILEAHLMMSRDELLIDAALLAIRDDRVGAEWAVERAVAGIQAHLRQSDEDYIRSRADDVEQVGRRIIERLVGRVSALPPILGDGVLVIDDLHPADAAQLLDSRVKGLVTGLGSATSHTAILARTLEIPAVVGVSGVTSQVGTDDEIIVDGLRSQVILDPSEDECDRARDRARRYLHFTKRLREHGDQSMTRDGVHVQLHANVDLPAEAALAVDEQAQGIGLYRTEFLYMNRPDVPTEEEQLAVYKDIATVVGTRPVVLRTVDMGGDNLTINDDAPPVPNPALGLRAIRLALARDDLFQIQLRAVLRAACFGTVRVMFPLVSGVAELDSALACLEEAKRQVVADGHDCGHVQVGTMIELPSAVLMAEHLARRCDFLSVGTNDLVQYTLAADRANPQVAYLGDTLDPAVLLQLDRLVHVSRETGRPLSMCGDMAADPFALPIAIGLGYRSLSVPVSALGLVREVLRHIDGQEARSVAQRALGCSTALEVRQLVDESFREVLGEIWSESGVNRRLPDDDPQ